MQIITILAPVFLLIGIGAVLQKTVFVSPGFLKEANRLSYRVGLPALLFSQLAVSFHRIAGAGAMLGTVLGASTLALLAGYLAAWLLRLPGPSVGTFVQGGFRGNLAFVGLPIIYALPDLPVAAGVSLRTAAILALAPMMLFNNVGGVSVLLLSQHRLGWRMIRPFLGQLVSTPPLVAIVAGVAYAACGWPLPAAAGRTLQALGEMALPLGLLAVGGSLATVRFREVWAQPLAAALIKTVAAPLFGWGLAALLGLGPLELKLALIFLACPTAAAAYTLAMELKGDETIASGVIVLSVFTSLVSLAVIIGVS